MKVVIVLCFCAFAVALTNASECKPGETKQEGGNRCFCTETGVWGCTRQKREDNNCTPDENKNVGCRICTCVENSEGRTEWNCDDTYCDIMYFDGRECDTVEEVTAVKCNLCNCLQTANEGKRWSCSRRVCRESNEYGVSPRKKRDNGVASDLNHTPCAPNDMFQIDCNTCYCNSDKTGYLCTDHICMPDNSTEIPIKNGTTMSTTVPTVSTTLNLNETEISTNVTETTEKSNLDESDSER